MLDSYCLSTHVLIAVLTIGLAGCSSETPLHTPHYDTISSPLSAWCEANVVGKGLVDVETDYLPHVICCENGAAPLEALKAQAVSARSYLYYKMKNYGKINDGTSDQVYSCSAKPKEIHFQAAKETAGEILQYKGVQVAAFYVAGSIPSASNCVAKPGDNDYSNTEKYVTYNWGKSGANLEQTTLGWVNPGNHANRGCKSQNGASCLAKKGWNYVDILNFYYGDDIKFEIADGPCVDGKECDCDPGEEEEKACDACQTKVRKCNSNCAWGAWSKCTGGVACETGAVETEECGQCGTREKTCVDGCSWSQWSACENQGACSAGATETTSCGRCGQRERQCSQQCNWTGWSSCTGQGECEPQNVEIASCGTCSYKQRTCSTSCEWNEYAECVLFDAKAEPLSCDTGLPGHCNKGQLECASDAVSCVEQNSPGVEFCDNQDNDCDGEIDNNATELSSPPPALAAEVVAIQLDDSLQLGQTKLASVSFKNVGTETWTTDKVSLIAVGPAPGATSLLWDPSWTSDNKVVALTQDTPPNAVAQFDFVVGASPSVPELLAAVCQTCEWTGAVAIQETFKMTYGDTNEIRCPAAHANVSVALYQDSAALEDLKKEPSTDGTDGTATTTSPTAPPVSDGSGTGGTLDGDTSNVGALPVPPNNLQPDEKKTSKDDDGGCQSSPYRQQQPTASWMLLLLALMSTTLLRRWNRQQR